MRAYVRTAASLAALAFCQGVAVAQAPNPASPIRSFDWTYQGTPEPGNRHWSSPDGVTWTETYPSGQAESQKVKAYAQVNGCHGVITLKASSPDLETFIPDPGCPTMALLVHVGDEAWRASGVMRSVIAEPLATVSPSNEVVTTPDADGSKFPQALARALTPPAASSLVTPESLAVAKRFVASLDVGEKLHAFGEFGVAQAKTKLAEQLQNQPAARRRVIEAAYLDTVKQVQQRNEEKSLDRMAHYYAGHLSIEDMKTAIAFYTSPLGALVVHPPSPPDAEKNQQIGKALLENPALQKASGAQFGLMKELLATRGQDEAKLLAEIKTGFCQRLAAARIRLSTCEVAARATDGHERL